MGTVSGICGVDTQPSPKRKKPASMKDILKEAFKAGDQAARNQYQFLKLAEELGADEELSDAVDEASAELAMEDEVAEPEVDEETELIEELIRAISDPEIMTDEDEDAALRAAETVENAEKEAGINAPTVADYLSMRMGW